MKKIVILVLALVLLASCGKEKKENPLDFTLKGLNGKEYTLSAQEGKVVIIDFWATWCRPCLMTIPIFNELYDKYRDKKLLILGVGLDGEEALRRFVQSHPINYPVLIGDPEIAKKHGVYAIPTTFIIDKKGNVASRHVGLLPGMQDTLEEEIKKLLTKK